MKPWMTWLITAALVAAAVFVARGVIQVSVGDVPINAADPVRFPNVTGSNLEGRKYQLPNDLEGELNIVALVFFGNHQSWVNSWVPTASKLTRGNPKLHFYEIPTLTNDNKPFRGLIDGIMHSGIPDKAAREATITLYLDRVQFLKTAGLPHDRTIYVLLVDRQGKIYWRGDGVFTPELGASLEQAIEANS
jgi:ATP10 protein